MRLSLFFTLLVCSFSVSAQIDAERVYRHMKSYGLSIKSTDPFSVPFDTVIDNSNPSNPYVLLKDVSHQVKEFQSPHGHYLYTYYINGKIKSIQRIKNQEIATQYYTEYETLDYTETVNSLTKKKVFYRGDTTITELYHPKNVRYYLKKEVKDSTIYEVKNAQTYSFQRKNWGDVPLNLTFYQTHTFTELLSVNETQMKVLFLQHHHLGEREFLEVRRTPDGLQHEASTTISAQGDTIRESIKIFRLIDGYAELKEATTTEYPNQAKFFERCTTNYSEKWPFGLKKYYDASNTLMTIEKVQISKPKGIHLKKQFVCGTPGVEREEIIPGKDELPEYILTYSKEPDAKLLQLDHFSYEDYFLLNAPKRINFSYFTDFHQMPSALNDTLQFEKGELSVEQFKNDFYTYLLTHKVKHTKENYDNSAQISLMISPKKSTWALSGNIKNKAFRKAFDAFIIQYDFTGLILETERGVYFSSAEKPSEFHPFTIQKIQWDIEW